MNAELDCDESVDELHLSARLSPHLKLTILSHKQ